MNESVVKVTFPETVLDPAVLSSRVIEAADVAPVQYPSVSEGQTVFRFAGQTYSDQVAVLVTVEVTNEAHTGRIVVNCEKMVIGSMLAKEIKTVLMKP